jgi:hypothetical protein
MNFFCVPLNLYSHKTNIYIYNFNCRLLYIKNRGVGWYLYYSNVNKPLYATIFGARFYCALTLHVSALIGGHLQVLSDKIYSKVATSMSTDPLSRHI